MRSAIRIFVVAGAMLALAAPAQAFKCPSLIREATAQLAKLDPKSDQATRVSRLVAEADSLHQAGKHADSVKKAEEAIAALKP